MNAARLPSGDHDASEMSRNDSSAGLPTKAMLVPPLLALSADVSAPGRLRRR